MGKTNIAWTEQTWNPVTGCSHVSRGCEHCYAETLSLRYGWSTKPWTAQNAAENVRLHEDRLEQPRHWKKPSMVFVNSMSDLFHELVPFSFIGHVFYEMSAADWHTYQILTKRPKRMLEFYHWMQGTRGIGQEPYDIAKEWPNVWMGVSCEDQKTADERIPLLLQMPTAIRFVSCEPLLGPIQLHWSWMQSQQQLVTWPVIGNPTISWVIVGGESGRNFRPMDLDWARSIRDQCIAAGVPFFFKQESGLRPGTNPILDGVTWHQFPHVRTEVA